MGTKRSKQPKVGAERRSRNPRGKGTALREEILSATLELLEELGDDEALSLRAVARAVGVAAPSVYIHFPDRDALVFAAMERCHLELLEAVNQAAAVHSDPAARLRRRARYHFEWGQQHPGLYKVIHESGLNRRMDMPFKHALFVATTSAVQACMEAGVVPVGDPEEVALDLRTAIHGLVSRWINQTNPGPPSLAEQQVDRFLTKIVGLPPAAPPVARSPGHPGPRRARMGAERH